MPMPMKPMNIGDLFGTRRVIEFMPAGTRHKPSVKTRCDECHTEAVIERKELARVDRLAGCQKCSVGNRTHGHTANGKTTPEFVAWCAMKQRCYDKNGIGYHNYGGRGITVCEEWRDDFSAFLRDMKPKPGRGYSLDRKDNSLGYAPSNCKWSTRVEQNSNRRNNVMLTAGVITQTATEWAASSGTNVTTLLRRVRGGMPLLEAIGWTLRDGSTQ